MPKNVRIEAIWKDEIDIHSCVLALLALAQELPPKEPPDPAEPPKEADDA